MTVSKGIGPWPNAARRSAYGLSLSRRSIGLQSPAAGEQRARLEAFPGLGAPHLAARRPWNGARGRDHDVVELEARRLPHAPPDVVLDVRQRAAGPCLEDGDHLVGVRHPADAEYDDPRRPDAFHVG